MTVIIPDDRRKAMLALLQHSWGFAAKRFTFHLREAAEVLGLLVYLCRVCPWGMFLFQNLYHAMAHVLERKQRILHDPKLRDTIAKRDYYQLHPTDSAKYRFFSQKVARAIYDSKATTFLTPDIRQEADFLITVLSDPATYRWGSPIAHLIPREHDGEAHQDACPQGAGGFSSDFDFWWIVVWPQEIFIRTQLPAADKCYISNNLLGYAALIFGLAGAILAWEALPVNSQPSHPMVLLWTNNMTARAWLKRLRALKLYKVEHSHGSLPIY